VATYRRSLNSTGIGNSTAFPSIPDVNTFINLGLNTRPTFFGCNSSNNTGPTPIVVYLPNYPYIIDSNTSTYNMQYNSTQRDAMILNGYDIATLSNGTRDSKWSTCVGCAILSRSFERTNTTVPDVCNTCFTTYCWNGEVNSTTPAAYEPSVNSTPTTATPNAGALTVGPSVALLVVGVIVTFFM
jgi:lysophospholipase